MKHDSIGLTPSISPCVATSVQSEPRSIGLIGAGRLAASFAAALVAAGYPVRAVASRDPASAEALARTLGVEPVSPREVVESYDVVFLTVPDAQVVTLAETLPWKRGQFVVHCSGAVGLGALATAGVRGAIPGCLHPLQSFPSRSPEPDRFFGIHCGIEAPDPLGRYLEALVADFGARSFRLEGVDRQLYHAAAVFMSNHVIALAAAATQLWELAGLQNDAREALAPLLLSASSNVSRLPLREALTGPVARGDVATVAAHLKALESAPELRELYRRLSAELLTIDLGHSDTTARRLAELLREP